MADVCEFIQSLIGPGDFAAQSGTDEFLLIYPSERGASAQRRLGQIAEQLWDFQLRSMGSLSILFSWGGVEVRSESIDEAIASATERMQETSGHTAAGCPHHGTASGCTAPPRSLVRAVQVVVGHVRGSWILLRFSRTQPALVPAEAAQAA